MITEKVLYFPTFQIAVHNTYIPLDNDDYSVKEEHTYKHMSYRRVKELVKTLNKKRDNNAPKVQMSIEKPVIFYFD